MGSWHFDDAINSWRSEKYLGEYRFSASYFSFTRVLIFFTKQKRGLHSFELAVDQVSCMVAPLLATATYTTSLLTYNTLLHVANSSLHVSHMKVILRSVNFRLSKSIQSVYSQNAKYAPLPDCFWPGLG
jgi:hypothetical protein